MPKHNKPHADTDSIASAPPPSTSKAARKRAASHDMRSASPAKSTSAATDTPGSARRKASPSKKRGRKSKQETEDAKAASRALQDATSSKKDKTVADTDDEAQALEATAAEVAEEVADVLDSAAEVKAAEKLSSPKVARVTVSEDVQDSPADGIETTRTSVKVEMPENGAEQPLPESPDEALKRAKDIMHEAKALKAKEEEDAATAEGASPNIGRSSTRAGKKRKAADLDTENPEEEIVTEVVDASPKLEQGVNGVAQERNGVALMSGTGDMVEFKGADGGSKGEPAAKRARVMVPADDFRRQKMQKRALMGLSTALAVG